jgi:hypothetical protein
MSFAPAPTTARGIRPRTPKLRNPDTPNPDPEPARRDDLQVRLTAPWLPSGHTRPDADEGR